jgi:nucleotide-binding universal stress UspA family protein
MSALVCCIDFSPLQDRVLAEAEALARALSADVILVHALPLEEPLTSGGMAPPGTHAVPPADLEERKRRLDAEVARLKERGLSASGKLLMDEQPADAVIREVAASKAAHIVIGSHGHAMVFELLVGSFTQAVLRRTKVPVVVVPVSRTET